MSSEQIAFSWMLLWRLKRHWWKVLLSVLLLCTAFCFPVATKNYFGVLHKKETLLTQPANYSELLNHSKHKLDILYSPMSQKVEGIMTEFRAIFPNTLINSISGLQNEHEVHKLFSWKYKTNENANKGFGVIFTNVDNKTLHYSLRSTDTDLWLTNKKFSHLMFPGPCHSGKMYFTEGFIGVQIGINLGYMKYYNKPINEWYIQEFPYPAHVENEHLEFINFYVITIAFSIGMIPISIWLIFSVINEKNKGANGLIKLKGGKSWMISGSVFIFFYSQVVIAVTISCIVMFIHFRNGPVFTHSIPLVVWSFFMSYGSVSLCYAYFCTALFNKTTYALLFFTICKSIPLSVFIIFKSKIIFLEYMLIVIPDFALLQGNKLATIYEASGVGLRLANIFEFTPGTEVSFISIIFIMLLAGFVLCLLTLYLSEIMPGQFEVPKPWHFIIPEKIKAVLIKDKIDISLLVMDLPTNYHVEEATTFSIGIQLYNITKVYGVFKALNSITMNIYKDQITAVLGHNGAGKTTLMNILTGMTLPNSGFVVVDGVNVNIWKTEYRKKFSYCPQKNLVLHSLSVKEQIIFFGIMSGLSKDVAEANGSQLMEKLDLVKQKNLLPNRLPEGVRRKLALANALISNPRILYLDEPTTGLDPKSRRQIWDILISFKGEKTIIITTHIMEEADVLGDRIAIMAHGELRCYGTTFFLKKLFSAGHTISVYYLRRKYHHKIVRLLKQYSDVTIIENRDFKQISFNIPLETTSKLSGILRRIENSKQFKISRIGISSTSLEDIFVRISKNEGLTSIVERSDFDKMCHKQTSIGKPAKCWQQYYALFYKKLRHLRANWAIMIVMLYLIPGIYSLFCMTIVKIHFGYHFTVYPFILSLENYEQSDVLARLDQNNYTEDTFLRTVKEITNVQLTTNDIVTELLKAAKYDETKYRSSMIIAADFLENFTVFYSSFAIHAPAIAVNVLFNVLTNSSIQAINYPYPFHLDSCDPSSSLGLQLATIWICFGICLAICLSYFCVYTLVERKTGVKHLQYMMGITPLTYWSFQLLFDLMKFSVTVFLFVLAVYLYNEGIFQTFNFLSVLIIALFLFGTCMILLCYTSSFFFKNYSLAQIWVSGVVLLFAPGPMVMDWLTNYNSVAHYLFHFSPLTAFLELIWQTMRIARLKTICKICSVESLRDVCKEVKEPALLTFNIKTLLIWLFVDCILYFCLLMLLDSQYLRAYVARKQGFKLERATSMDSDVMFERQKVEGKVPIQTRRKTSTPDQKDTNIASFEHLAKFNVSDDKKSPKNTSVSKGGVKSDLVHENIVKQTSPELFKVDREKNVGLANFKKTSPESLKNNDPSLNPTVTSNNEIEINLGNIKRQTSPNFFNNKHLTLNPTVSLDDIEIPSPEYLADNQPAMNLTVVPNNIERERNVGIANIHTDYGPRLGIFEDNQPSINLTPNNIERESNVDLASVQRTKPPEIPTDNRLSINSTDILNNIERESHASLASFERLSPPGIFKDNRSSLNPTVMPDNIEIISNLDLSMIKDQTLPEMIKDKIPSLNQTRFSNSIEIESNLGLTDIKKPTSAEYLKEKRLSLNPADELNNTIESNLGLSNFRKQTPPEVVKNKHPSLNPTDILNDTIEGNSLTTNQQPLKIIQEKDRSTSINLYNNLAKESNNLGLASGNTQTFIDVPKANWLMRDSLDLQYIAKENNLEIASPVNPIPDVMIDKWPSLKPTIVSNKLTTEKLASTTNEPSTTAHDNRKWSRTKTGDTNTGISKSNVEQTTGRTPLSEDLVTTSDSSRMLQKHSPNPSKSSHGSHSSNLEKPLVMVVDNLGKKYSAKTTAVYDVSFTCLKGDCLGIVGPHGAGKSTLFMMITGLITPTKGDVRLYLASRSLSISANRREFLSYLGYCPQIDSLSIELTGREILKFFALLRGIPIKEIEQVTDAWIKNLDLQLYGDKLCGQYSNGNKRKLCTALSLIGNPYVVLLDEPTSGIDTVTKKKLWVLFKYFQSLDETLVLNTHSMEECEVICNKITVMINGTLKCIGSMQHLKNKYTHGFTLYIKINNIQSSTKLPFLKSSLTNVFKENCQLKYEGEGFLHYHVNSDNLKCYELFEKMESIKSSCDCIDEYTISDTNLENVFIDLANEGEKE